MPVTPAMSPPRNCTSKSAAAPSRSIPARCWKGAVRKAFESLRPSPWGGSKLRSKFRGGVGVERLTPPRKRSGLGGGVHLVPLYRNGPHDVPVFVKRPLGRGGPQQRIELATRSCFGDRWRQ